MKKLPMLTNSSKGRKPVEVAIQLGLSERQATRYYTEYWRLRHLYKLHFIYKESKGNLSTFLRLYRLVKRLGIRIKGLGVVCSHGRNWHIQDPRDSKSVYQNQK